MKYSSIVFGATAILMMTGCTAMLPYDSEFTCNKGNGKGICGSMSEIYGETLKNKDSNESLSATGQTGSCSKCPSVQGQTDASCQEHYITAPDEKEEIIYALYRKEKDSHTKNVQQDERLAALEMQAKLLIANNGNLSNKFAELQNQTQKAPITNYPIYGGEKTSDSAALFDGVKKEKKKKSIKKRVKKIFVPAEKPEEFEDATGVVEVIYKDSFARAAPNLLRPTVAEPIHKGEQFNYTGKSKSWYRLKSGLYVSKKVVKEAESAVAQAKAAAIIKSAPSIKGTTVKAEAKK